MMQIRFFAAIASMFFAVSAESQAPLAPSSLTYADLADLALPAPVTAYVRISSAIRLKGKNATTVPAGKVRYYIEADILSLIKGPSNIPAKVSYLLDLPVDVAGRAPKLKKKSEFLLFASIVAGRPNELQLTAMDAHIPWNMQDAERVRQMLTEASQADAAPQISGIGRAFNVPGTLPGESETQIFLQTVDARPISLSILRRPGEQVRWAVALSEMVDDAAEPPRPDTLLWYRLACTLPGKLPAQSLADNEPAQRSAIEADYRLVLEELGPCARNRVRL
jgi:hypothetical protein